MENLHHEVVAPQLSDNFWTFLSNMQIPVGSSVSQQRNATTDGRFAGERGVRMSRTLAKATAAQ